MPDNAIFYYLAYAAATGIYAGYALILASRRKRVRAATDRFVSSADESR